MVHALSIYGCGYTGGHGGLWKQGLSGGVMSPEPSACPSVALSIGVPLGSPEAGLKPVARERGVWSEEAQTPGSSPERELFSHSSFPRRAGYLYELFI